MTEDRGASYLELFIEVTNAITASFNLDEVFNLITQKISKVIGVDAATIWLLDASGKKLALMASHGLSQAYLNRGPIDTEEPIFKALKGEAIVISDAVTDSRINYPEATREENVRAF